MCYLLSSGVITVSRSSLIVADLCLIAITVVAVPWRNVFPNRRHNPLMPLANIVLRDGKNTSSLFVP